jgi:DNA-binding NtrC family response regulator/HAMP domain-containing protein
MALRTIKSKLLVGVSALVIGTALVISLLVSHRYSTSLETALTAQAENLAHAAALEAAEMVLTNDVVALQKMLEYQMRSNPAISYLFIKRDGKILAHTFPRGVPTELVDANVPLSPRRGSLEKIVSTEGERYLDFAWPIFEGKAGVLRLGISEKHFEDKLWNLWLEMGGLTLGILVLALGAGLLFVRRIARPIGELAQAAQRLDGAALDVEVVPRGNDEVAALASSFNTMVTRIRDFTLRLEEKTQELERTHNQTRVFCEIVRELGSLPTLGEVGSALIYRIAEILKCKEMALLILNENQDALYVLSESGVSVVRDEGRLEAVAAILERLDDISFDEAVFNPPLVPKFFESAVRQAIIPLEQEHQLRGALVIACPGQCNCDFKEADWVSLILTQSAGVVRRALLQEEARRDLEQRMGVTGFRGLIGKDPKMQLLYRLIEDIAPNDATVLIQGESGTGKELVARAIHLESDRRDEAFVVINCSAYPDTLLESELFGHERGAFTGAIRRRIGRFEQADRGTVFLDEIGEIPPQAQIKLLRVLQTQEFERVGGEETVRVDVRVIAATNRDLLRDVEQGTFREDLFFRLNVIPIEMAPLRKRRNDIPSLANHFLRRFLADQGKDIQGFSSDAMRAFLDYGWPGNVRELENSVEHAVVVAKGYSIELSDLPSAISRAHRGAGTQRMSVMEESEKAALQRVLEECGWNKKEAARRLGIGRTTLYTKLKKYRISKPTVH